MARDDVRGGLEFPLGDDLDLELDAPDDLDGEREPRGSLEEEEEAGHSWAQYVRDSVREPYGGAGGSGEFPPYGGRRFAWGREGGPRPEYGQLYGYQERGYGHRRNSYYAAAGATPWWEVEPEAVEGELPLGPMDDTRPRVSKRPDVRIEEEVVQRLEDAEWVDATDVVVEVADGVVTLSGEVGARSERFAAEDIAAEVAGVVDVIDRLRARQRDRH